MANISESKATQVAREIKAEFPDPDSLPTLGLTIGGFTLPPEVVTAIRAISDEGLALLVQFIDSKLS